MALLRDEQVMEEALALHGALMLYAPFHIQDNARLVEIAMSNYPGAIKVCSDRLRSDECFMRRLLVQHGSRWLRYAGRQLRDNGEFVVDLMKHDLMCDAWGFKYASHRVRSDPVIAQWILARTLCRPWSDIHWGVNHIPLATQVRAEFVYGSQVVQELTWAILLVNWLCAHGRAEPKEWHASKWLWRLGHSPMPTHILEKIVRITWPVGELISNAHEAYSSLKAGTRVWEPACNPYYEKVISRLQSIQPGASAVCVCDKEEYPCRECDNRSADAWIEEHASWLIA